MRNTLSTTAARMSLIAFAAGGFTLAQDTPAPAGAEQAPVESPQTPADGKDAQAEAPADPAAAKPDSSYALGYRTGGSFSQEFGQYGVTLDDLEMERFIQGFTAAVKGDKPEVEDDRLQKAMASLGELLQKRETESAESNLAAGKKFIEENGKREGVVTTESGLQYEVLEKGGDAKYVAPEKGGAEKQFMVNYKGTLIDGTEFDASPEGSTVPMTLQVIPGMKEAITTMPVGAKWRIFLPSELAYGAERRSAEIGPNSVLIFDIALDEIKDAPPAPEGGGFPMPMPMPKSGE